MTWDVGTDERLHLRALGLPPLADDDDLPPAAAPVRVRRLAGRRVGSGALTDEVVMAAYSRYRDAGLSVRGVAAEIWEGLGYASQATCANLLHEAFRVRGLRLRDRIAAAVATHTIHGRSGTPEYRREQARARGEVRDVRCMGVRTQYPGKGLPCRSMAAVGSHYCRAHDPARAHEREAHLARMRERRGVAA